MRTNHPSFFAGLFLIILGIISLITLYMPNAWPVVLICIGLFFLVIAARWRVSWPVVTGLVNGTLGGILLYQTLTGDWKSWYFMWPLIFTAVGTGLLITERIDRLPAGAGRLPYLRVSWAFLALGLLFSIALWVFRAALSWPVIIWGMGALFLLAALVSSIGPLAIPGTVLGGLGAMLAWMNYSGTWDAWAFSWALIPAFVGIGLFLAFVRSRTMRLIGLSMLSWSLVAFAVFGIFFAGHGALLYLWPVILILAGIVVLFQVFLSRAQVGQRSS